MVPRVLMMAFIAALIGCGDPLPPETTALRLEGVVEDAVSHDPIEGATLTLWNRFDHPWDGTREVGTWVWAVDTTDARGRYALEYTVGLDIDFPCDGFQVTAEATGFRPDTVTAAGYRCDPDWQILDFELSRR